MGIDANNYLDAFLDKKLMRESPWRALQELDKRVAAFATAAHKQTKHFFIAVFDADQQSAEVTEKWSSRRERELRNEKRNVVLGTDTMLSDALTEKGVPVVRLLGADADDVLAALACAGRGGGVMSCDTDFLEYEPRPRIFNGWRVNAAGELCLWAKPPRGGSASAVRTVDPRLAELALASLDTGAAITAIRDKYDAAARGGRITRGVSSSSDRRRGNLHALAAPLRAAVYHALGEKEAVMETIPEWDREVGGVAWRQSALQPDPALRALLSDATAAAAWLDERDGDDLAVFPCDEWLEPWTADEVAWRAQERRFNRRVLACEMATVVACADSERAGGGAAAAAGVGSVLARLRSFPEYTSCSQS